jgi:hypothetical protein
MTVTSRVWLKKIEVLTVTEKNDEATIKIELPKHKTEQVPQKQN